MKIIFRQLFILLLTISAGSALADTIDCTADENKDRDACKEVDLLGTLGEFGFAVGLGFEHYREPYISDYRTLGDDRIVTITDSQSQRPTLWLETHYIFDKWRTQYTAPGFYIGTRVAGHDTEVFDAFSLGFLWTFKRTAFWNDTSDSSINIGVGPVWHKTRTLAPGIMAGEPLPDYYNDVEFSSSDEVSWMLMISFGI